MMRRREGTYLKGNLPRKVSQSEREENYERKLKKDGSSLKELMGGV